MKTKLPSSIKHLRKAYPDVWKQFERLGEACHDAGPLGERTRRVAKVAIAAAAQTEGGVHSAVRTAQAAGVSAGEIRHAILLTLTTIGFPRAMAAMSWAEDVLRRRSA